MDEMKEPLISIIIPVYNTDAYLACCLDSIITQDYNCLEIICINDGSTDSSSEILQAYAKKDPRIRIIDQENQGISEARNAGVKIARGKYLYFMDSDDILECNAFEILVENMESRDLDAVLFNAAAFADSQEFEPRAASLNNGYLRRDLYEEKVFSGWEIFSELKNKGQFVATVWALMLKKDLFFEKDLWFQEHNPHQDEPWTFAVLMHAKRIGCVNKKLYKYRVRSDSITTSVTTFKHYYGCFIASQDIQKTICKLSDEMEPDFFELCVSHAVKLQTDAILKYCRCSEDEKLKRKALAADERISFEKIVVRPATLRDQAEQQKRKIESEKKKLAEEKNILTDEKKKLTEDKNILTDEKKKLTEEINVLIKEKKRLKNELEECKKLINCLRSEIDSVYQSETYRVGDVVTRIPRMLKDRISQKDVKKG